MQINSIEQAEATRVRALELIESGRGQEAAGIATKLSGIEPITTSLRALIWTEAGERLSDPEILGRGRDSWELLGPDGSSQVAYNLANAELGLWTVVAQGHRYAEALHVS